MATTTFPNITRGDTVPVKLTITDAANAPIDITGNTFFFTIKKNYDDLDANALLQVSATAPSGSLSTGGVITLTLQVPTTMELGTFYYDVQRVISGSPDTITTLAKGSVTIEYDVTTRTS